MPKEQRTDWILSNQSLKHADWPLQAEWLGIHFGSTESSPRKIETGTLLVYDGYAIPRMGTPEKCDLLLGGKIPFVDVREMSLAVKGHFTVAWATSEGVTLCIDHHGMSKVFLGRKGDGWWVSNNVRHLISIINPDLDEIGLILFNLFEHFIGNRTMFKNIRLSRPAAVMNMNEKQVIEEVHWQPLQWLDKPKIHSDMQEWAEFWKGLIKGYLKSLNIVSPTLTLTGGNDSRMILAALLALGANPETFTFGSPASYDAIISAEISRHMNITHHIHFVEQPSAAWFRDHAREIVRRGNSLINVHRAHRLDAIRNEDALAKDRRTLFAGFMGGDYLKGLSYDDYITAKFWRLWKERPVDLRKHLAVILEEKCIRLTDSAQECLMEEIIPSLSFANLELAIPVRELLFIYEVVGSMHDYQDTTVFSWEACHVVNPFMDVDFLERLWTSPFSSLAGHPKGSAIRVNFGCRMTHMLAPEMSDIPYGKWGGYTARELISYPHLLAVKRIWRHLLKKDRHARNFPYGEWFLKYAVDELSQLHQEIKHFYDMERLRDLLSKEYPGVDEGKWHRVTNPINLSLNWLHFTEN